MRLPPKQAFPHAIQYKHLNGTDDWDKPSYDDPVDVPFVRFDEGFDFKRQGVNATDDMPNALITLFKKYNPDIPTFTNQSEILFNNGIYTIVKVIPLYFVSDEIIGYELEVK